MRAENTAGVTSWTHLCGVIVTRYLEFYIQGWLPIKLYVEFKLPGALISIELSIDLFQKVIKVEASSVGFQGFSAQRSWMVRNDITSHETH
jgi:hypothetical protein